MPVFKQWTWRGGVFAIWKVTETAGELRESLRAGWPYDEELERLKAPSRKLEYLAVRVLLRFLCGEEKNVEHYSSGKPFLSDHSFCLTISHTRGYVAVGLHPSAEVGIDIEQCSGKVERIFPRFLSEKECERVRVLPEKERRTALLLYWSGKETLYKILKEDDIDFRRHLYLSPFLVRQEGNLAGTEFRTPLHSCYELRYWVHTDFVCTWCVPD